MKKYNVGERIGKVKVSAFYLEKLIKEDFVKSGMLDCINVIEILPTDPLTKTAWIVGSCEQFDKINKEDKQKNKIPEYRMIFSKHGLGEVNVRIERERDEL